MSDEMRSFCEEYAKAWYSGDFNDRIKWQRDYSKRRKNQSDAEKRELSQYLDECCREYEKRLPYKEHIGIVQFNFVKA